LQRKTSIRWWYVLYNYLDLRESRPCLYEWEQVPITQNGVAIACLRKQKRVSNYSGYEMTSQQDEVVIEVGDVVFVVAVDNLSRIVESF
jgi:hypothetical protein